MALWVVYSALMFISSVTMYLAVRVIKDSKVDLKITNLAMYGIPAICSLVFILAKHIPFSITIMQAALILLFGGCLCNYVGNLLSLKGIQNAANPGFSLIIQKSYGAITLFAAPFLFGSSITPLKVAGTLIVVLFSFIIASEKGKRIFSGDNRWLIYTLGALGCFALYSLFSKAMLRSGVNVFVFLFFVTLGVSICNLLHLLMKRTSASLRLSSKIGGILLVIGLLAFSFNIFLNLALQAAPNIGYVGSINASSIAALTVCSSLIFNDELNARKLIGVLGVMAGIFLVVL